MMANYIIERHIKNHGPNITEAAHRVLLDWRKNQSNDIEAYNNLSQALKKVNMIYYIESALQEPKT